MTSTTTVMKEMKDQMVALAEKVEEFQHNQTLTNRGLKCEEDNTMGPGNSEALTESTHGASGSGLRMLANAEHKMWDERISVPDCDSIQCPKLDPVIQAIVQNGSEI